MRIRNITDGPRGVNTVSGPVLLEPGQTIDVELSDAERAVSMGTGWFVDGAAADKADKERAAAAEAAAKEQEQKDEAARIEREEAEKATAAAEKERQRQMAEGKGEDKGESKK